MKDSRLRIVVFSSSAVGVELHRQKKGKLPKWSEALL